MNLLPDIPGYVHGLVAVDPVYIVQCDGCGRVAVGDVDRHGKPSTLVILSCGILFDGGRGDKRRLCGQCRLDADWQDSGTRDLRTRPKDQAFLESQMRAREEIAA